MDWTMTATMMRPCLFTLVVLVFALCLCCTTAAQVDAAADDRRLQILHPEVTGSNADAVCASYKNTVFGDFGKAFQTTCTCTGDVTESISVSCRDNCFVSLDGRDGRDSKYVVNSILRAS